MKQAMWQPSLMLFALVFAGCSDGPARRSAGERSWATGEKYETLVEWGMTYEEARRNLTTRGGTVRKGPQTGWPTHLWRSSTGRAFAWRLDYVMLDGSKVCLWLIGRIDKAGGWLFDSAIVERVTLQRPRQENARSGGRIVVLPNGNFAMYPWDFPVGGRAADRRSFAWQKRVL